MKSILVLIVGIVIGLIAGIVFCPAFQGDERKSEKTALKEESASKMDKSEKASEKSSAERESTQQNKSMTEKGNIQESMQFSESVSILAKNISRKKAYGFFDHYHGITDQDTKSACFKITVKGVEKDIESIYLPYDSFLNVMYTRVRELGEEMIGLAGIPAYNTDSASHTLIWAPVIKGSNGERLYYFPDSEPKGLLIDYIDVCPPMCYDNDCILRQKDWKYDNSPTSQCKDPLL